MEGLSYDRVLMLPYSCFDVSGTLKPIFKAFSECYNVIKPLNHPEPAARFPYFYFKVQAFSLVEYEKVLFLEPYSITNDDQLDLYLDERPLSNLPAAPLNAQCGPENGCFETMMLKPDRNIFQHLMANTYGQHNVIAPDVVASKIQGCQWTAISNETDKEQWFHYVRFMELQRGIMM